MGRALDPVVGVAGCAEAYRASIVCLNISFLKHCIQDLSGYAKYSPSRMILPAHKYSPTIMQVHMMCNPPQKKHIEFGYPNDS
jgi:hypothetical protein